MKDSSERLLCTKIVWLMDGGRLLVDRLMKKNGKMDTNPKDSMLSQKEKIWLVKNEKFSQAIFLCSSILILEKIC